MGVGCAVSPEASSEVGLLWLVPPEAAALAISWLLLLNSQLFHEGDLIETGFEKEPRKFDQRFFA